jgi:hypothetical protein
MNKLPYTLRLLFIACAGVGTFYATSQWAMGKRDEQASVDELVVLAAPRAAATAASTGHRPEAPPVEPDLFPGSAERAKSIPDSKGDPFAHLSWLPPPPPPPLPPPPASPPRPAAPVTPPLPFTFVGMIERGEEAPAAFLAKGDLLRGVSEGDLLDSKTYRVEALNAKEIVMTYLPMNIRQTLSVSGSSK